MVDRVGQQFGNYRLQRLLGQGGFAEVYLGEHIYLQTQAAIKILRILLLRSELRDFLREARVLAHLEHPHIIRVLDFGLQESIPFLVMQYAPHGSLRQRHPPGTRLSLEQVVAYVKDITSALQYAHEQRVVHRDIKPENMLLGRQDELLVSDFGVSVALMRAQNAGQQEAGGTIPYMAPEQIQGNASPASDQYALGVVVYEWLCGARPFTGSAEQIIQQHTNAPPPPLRDKLPAIPPAVEQVVLKALAKEPGERFASIQDFAVAIEQACEEEKNSTLVVPVPVAPSLAQDSTKEHAEVTAATSRPEFWNVPYRRNPFFTGREDILHNLHLLLQQNSGEMQALSGLGGIGKTQTAIEYAYRYRSEYQAVLWAAAGTEETLFAAFASIAKLLDVEQPDQQSSIEAVKGWLATHSDWLLILDNVEALTMLDRFIPPASKGHVLLTTRSQFTGTLAHPIELEKMQPDEGALFLLRRAKLIESSLEEASAADAIEARDIAQIMDGLPLALDQAGAYIEETGCSLFEYIRLYREQHSTLLDWRGEASSEHPEPVTTTWLLSFAKVEQANPAAADLLRLCAFLDANGIPEEIITAGAADLGELLQPVAADPHKLDAAIATLRRFSLVYRNPDSRMLTIHRLVQVIVRDRMTEEMQRTWAERAVRAVNRLLPGAEEVAAWPLYQRCLSNVQACVLLIEQWHMIFPEAVRLLSQAGLYLLEQAQYAPARQLFKKALAIREQLLGPEHLDVADSLNDLASSYLYQGMYAEAEPLFQRALAIFTHILGTLHPDVAVALNNLALLYHQQGKYAEAEPLFQQALATWKQSSGLDHADAARTLSNLALLYHYQQRFAEAEPLYLQAIAIWERIRGPEHPHVAATLNNLAMVYQSLGKYEQAEPLFQRALAIREKTLGLEHPAIAQSLSYLARLHQSQWRYIEAEALFKHALHIRRQTLGPDHPGVANGLNNLARLYTATGKYAEAEPLYEQALDIYKRTVGLQHPQVATILRNYALLLSATGRKAEAARLAMQAKAMRMKHVPHQSSFER